MKLVPRLLVLLQFTGIFYILLTAPSFAPSGVLIGIEVLGVLLGLWAIAIMRIGNFNVTPTYRKNAILRTKGPYAVIRHPMYTAIIITLLPLIIAYYSPYRLIGFICLVIVLIVKLNYEEKQLKINMEGYSDYANTTKRIIPFLY